MVQESWITKQSAYIATKQSGIYTEAVLIHQYRTCYDAKIAPKKSYSFFLVSESGRKTLLATIKYYMSQRKKLKGKNTYRLP
jgi:hypothetical protein